MQQAQDANAEWQCHGFRTGEDQEWCRTVGVDGCTEYKARMVGDEEGWEGGFYITFVSS